MKLTRRHVLHGLGGAAVALPLLESWPFGSRRRTHAQEQAQTFAVFLRQANGVAAEQGSPLSDSREPERFWPRTEGALSAESLTGRALDELLDHRDKLLVVGNVNMRDFPYGDGHARGALQGLTARGPTEEGAAGDSEAAGESIDHRIGLELNADGRDSLFLYAGSSGGWLGGPCISYRGSGERRAALHNPLNAYETVAGVGSGLAPQAATLLRERQKSVNDLLRGQMQRLMSHPRLSSSDRERLQLHFDSIRETEVAVACRFDEEQERALDGAGAIYDSGDGDDVWATARLHIDIAALAVACGYTRSVAIQIGNGNDGNNRYRDPDTGQLMENFHYLSHRRLSHDDNGDVIPNSDILHHKVDRQFAQLFKYLIDRFEQYALPDGSSLLSHGVAVWYNDLGNGPAHSPRNTPFVLAGSAEGYFKQGQYIRVGGDENHAQVLNTIATAVGVRKSDGSDFDDFGDPSLDGGLRDELKAV